MELGDTSNEEASPPQARKREMLKSQQIQMVSMLQMLEMDNGMRRGAFTIVTKSFGMASSTVHRLWNRVVHMHHWPYYFSGISFPQNLYIHLRSSMRESRISHCRKGILKESWQCQWGCQRHWCIVGLLIQPYVLIQIH